ncbi:SDR family NAD(P)-dependent oxidoreductase [Psychromicrobium sp. YIM B11713]|uniref:SDR family NAD(P)-dependent oxidoreductase n=1 Tax=Psychromicrobium sp. YIM B11713 TaxID=3145233 RepID=UPI00374FC8CB
MPHTSSTVGSVLITGPTGGLGRATTLELARRPQSTRPDLLLVGRAGPKLAEIAREAREAGATVHEIPTDLSRLADVGAAAAAVQELIDSEAARPLSTVIANAGWSSADTREASHDGFEMTFAVNYLAHAQLIGDLHHRKLIGASATPTRIVLLSSNLYNPGLMQRMMGMPRPVWRDPVELATPAAAGTSKSTKAAAIAYANAKLALIYYAHEAQRKLGDGVAVVVFEPGWMPGTGLSREQGAAVQAISRMMARMPGATTPERSAPALASVALDSRWEELRDGAFIEVDRVIEVAPFARDRDRENRLWEATTELLQKAAGL